MSINAQKTGENKAVVKIQGEFDNKNCLAFKEEILQFILDDVKEVRIDVSEMDFIDSPGIGLLISSSIAMQKNDGELIVEEPQMHVLDLLEATQATRYLKIGISQ